jgi:hypothetical protein
VRTFIRTQFQSKRVDTDFFFKLILLRAIKVGTQFGTQKCAERAVEAVDAVHAVRNLLSKFSAC